MYTSAANSIRPLLVSYRSLCLAVCLLGAQFAPAQCLAPFQDFNNFVYLFDAGQSNYIENLPLRSYKVGRNNIFAYIAANNRLKVYYRGKTFTVNDNTPNYYMTDNWLLYQNFNQIKVLYENQFLTIENFFRFGEDSLYYSDSLIVWQNTLGELSVFYEGKTQIIERSGIQRAKIGDNVFAYIDLNGTFKVFYQGKTFTLETYEPVNFLVDRDMIMYIDYYGNFKYFDAGEAHETQQISVNEYWTGQGFACYISQLKQLVVYYKGEETILMQDRPQKLIVKENLIVYLDKGNNFWCWYKGKKYWLERYVPRSIEVDNDIIVYQDLDGRLRGFYYGEQLDISDQIVKKYNLYNEAVTYSLQPYETKVWCNKKTYTFQ